MDKQISSSIRIVNLCILILIFLVGFDIYVNYISKPSTTDPKIFTYLDSVRKSTDALLNKVDSLERVKTNVYKEITKIKLRYDTVQIAIDTMPDIEGTKLLLSISRQLTAKGVE